MVTSNKLPEKKVVKMAEQNNSIVVPQRTLLGEVNEHITCSLCRGYYIDATTIVECLHSFCRSCIIKHLQVKDYCPECEMIINKARPNIKPDKALQDIVYKLVPGLFQREMERRQTFYASRPGPAASATPEQRGEDTERIIFSPEDVISFSLEYADGTDTDSISSKSSDSNEPQPASAVTRRYLQCPAVVNVSHLKKFICMKFDIDSSLYSVEILYKRVHLSDYYTLMDIAYIYNWKRNEPMRFFYQIKDYIAIRTRYALFDINKKDPHYGDRKASPTPTDDNNKKDLHNDDRKASPTPTDDNSTNSPALPTNEQGSEASSGTDSPMPEDNIVKKASEASKKQETQEKKSTDAIKQEGASGSKTASSTTKKGDEDDEKFQFLNSFELTAKNAALLTKGVSVKLTKDNIHLKPEVKSKEGIKVPSTNLDDTMKRKLPPPPTPSEIKKSKIEADKSEAAASPSDPISSDPSIAINSPEEKKKPESAEKLKEEKTLKNCPSTSLPLPTKEIKPHLVPKPKVPENIQIKRPAPLAIPSSPKHKSAVELPQPTSSKINTPPKLQMPKPVTPAIKTLDTPRPVKKIPDLKSGVSIIQNAIQKGQSTGKVRMDLLANNCDPTKDRNLILSQVNSSLSSGKVSGNPLKSLFDSCKLNIPSSLSITLTDQKLEQRSQSELPVSDSKKCGGNVSVGGGSSGMINKNLSLGGNNSSGGSYKVPSPPVHNYIEILKLSDPDSKIQQTKPDSGNPQAKLTTNPKTETPVQPKPPIKSESSAKGPVPSLKPIGDTKLPKTSGGIPITFQQTFEKQLQAITTTDKPKLPKNKLQVPKLMPVPPKALSAANNKLSNKPVTPPIEPKPPVRSDNALDLSTAQNIHSPLGPQQTKAFETMKSIANLAKKQSMPARSVPQSVPPSMFSGMSNRPVGFTPLRVPIATNLNHSKSDKVNSPGTSTSQVSTPRQDPHAKLNAQKQTSSPGMSSPGYQTGSQSSSTAHPSPISQTRSPSSSPKLVIAEEKQTSSLESNINQSNQITSTQATGSNSLKTELPKSSPGPSKQLMKPKSLVPSAKIPSVRPPPGMSLNTSGTPPVDYHAMAQQAFLINRHMNMELQNAWLKHQSQLMVAISRQSQNDFNKDNSKQ